MGRSTNHKLQKKKWNELVSVTPNTVPDIPVFGDQPTLYKNLWTEIRSYLLLEIKGQTLPVQILLHLMGLAYVHSANCQSRWCCYDPQMNLFHLLERMGGDHLPDFRTMHQMKTRPTCWRILVLSLPKCQLYNKNYRTSRLLFHLKVVYVQDERKWANWRTFCPSVTLDSISTLFHLVQETQNNTTEWIKPPLKIATYSQHQR